MIAHISDDGLGREESVAEHARKTAALCRENGARCGLSQAMFLCGLLHDAGKSKQAFSNYLHAGEKERRKLRGTIAHASTGAKYIYDRYHGRDGSERVMAEMISYAIAAHHGMFDCVDRDHVDRFSGKLGSVEDYEEACGNAKRDYLDEYDIDQIFSDAAEEFQVVWDKVKELFQKLMPLFQAKDVREKTEMSLRCSQFLFSCLQRLMLSILIDADWEATSDFMRNANAGQEPSEEFAKSNDAAEIFQKAAQNFDAYMQNMQNSLKEQQLTDKEKAIFAARDTLQKMCRQFAKHPAGVYCLPIPTGAGKTLSGFAYALEYCRQHPETERILYVSPYISITEQNAQVFREAIGCDEWILEHHSSVLRDDGADSEDEQPQGASRFEINWEERFICTTFVQFMNTLFSEHSASIRRMHRLANAVVIIDEVQSMPVKCVHTFNYMISFLNAVCSTNIILCTATQPTLADARCPICYSEPKDMIDNSEDWYRKFERVKIVTPARGQKYTFETLGAEIAERTAEYPSILVVLNTKSAVRKLYDVLKAHNVKVFYLTTNLCAEHRSDRLASIKEALGNKKEPIVVISTNLIEAGVDISFACVYRSMTGLDSLAQTAGRCNRNGELDIGIVNLIELEGENTGNMKELQQNMRITEDILLQYRKEETPDSLLMQRWLNEYYRQVYFYDSDRMNFPIVDLETNVLELLSTGFYLGTKKNFMNQAFKTAGQAYRVIDDHSFGVIVPYEKGQKLIAEIQETTDYSQIKTCIRQTQRYTVNVRESRYKELAGLIQPVSEKIPGLYMVAAPGAYSQEYGIVPEWETLIV